MRKAGQAKADKKSGRTAAEGLIVMGVSDDKKHAVMVEINSETDFVARDDTFKAFAADVASTALSGRFTDVEALNSTTLADRGQTVEQARQTTIAKIGENIKVRRLQALESDDVIGHYSHGGRIGVLVSLKGGDEALAKGIAMHIAASQPVVVSRDDVPEELVKKERDIFEAQAKESGKPQEIIEKMITGRINKFLDEVSLLGQAFVKDPDVKISKLLKDNNAEVVNFLRLEVGEGIEKKEDNFVEEVMSQVREG